MGTIFSSTKIYKIDVPKSSSAGDQTVVYSTTEARTLTFRAIVGVHVAGVQTAYYSLRDYTCTRSGTSIDFTIQLQPGNSGNMAIQNLSYGGDIIKAQRNDDAGNVTIEYGIRRYHLGQFIAMKYNSTVTGAAGLLVQHLLWSASDSCLVVFRVWYDVEKGYFACDRIGPFRRPTIAELEIDVDYALGLINPSNAATSTDGIQTAITGLINNGGPVRGNFNGAINTFINNYHSNR